MRRQLASTVAQMRRAVAAEVSWLAATCQMEAVADLLTLSGQLSRSPWSRSECSHHTMPLAEPHARRLPAAAAAGSSLQQQTLPLLPLLLRQRLFAAAPATTAAARGIATVPDRDHLIDARLKALSEEHEALQKQLHDGGVSPSSERYQQLSRRAGMLQVVADGYAQLMRLQEELAGAEELMSSEGSEEMRDLAREERGALRQQISDLRESLVSHLLTPDEDDEKNAVLEIRSGVGGEWAAAFAGDLLEMYRTYAGEQGWQFEILAASYSDHGGVKSADAVVSGTGAYGRLRWESGVHRAQAVPFTEKSGRMQTGTATVAVMAEATESDISIAESDLKVDTFRASGAGGQHVNTTDSAVRVTHVPTGLVVACQSERSQHQNRAKALRLLRSKVQEAERAKVAASMSAVRQQAHGGARFNERIRTFHYVDGRVTDHRVPGMSVMGGVERVLSGDMLGAVMDAVAARQREIALDELLGGMRGGSSEEAAAAAGGQRGGGSESD